jgi:hypothetical protein
MESRYTLLMGGLGGGVGRTVKLNIQSIRETQPFGGFSFHGCFLASPVHSAVP